MASTLIEGRTDNERSIMESTKIKGDGTRKVALLLSILDQGTVDSLLNLFESETAELVVREAQRVKNERVPPEEIVSVVSEFAELLNATAPEFATAIRDEATRNIAERTRGDGKSVFLGELDSPNPNVLETLRLERPTVIAQILSLFPQGRLDYVFSTLPTCLAKRVRAIPSIGSTDNACSEYKKILESTFEERSRK